MYGEWDHTPLQPYQPTAKEVALCGNVESAYLCLFDVAWDTIGGRRIGYFLEFVAPMNLLKHDPKIDPHLRTGHAKCAAPDPPGPQPCSMCVVLKTMNGTLTARKVEEMAEQAAVGGSDSDDGGDESDDSEDGEDGEGKSGSATDNEQDGSDNNGDDSSDDGSGMQAQREEIENSAPVGEADEVTG